MLRETKFHHRTEGIIQVGINDETMDLYLYEDSSRWPRKKVSLGEDSYIDESGPIQAIYDIIKYVSKRDLALFPEVDFTPLNKINQDNIVRYDIGLGYLYPVGNQYIYIAKKAKNLTTKRTPIKVRGATIEDYIFKKASYKVRDAHTNELFEVPYYILDAQNYTGNPLLHFSPFVKRIEVDKGLKDWRNLKDSRLQVTTEVHAIGSTVKLYIKDRTGIVYESKVNYAAVANMSVHKLDVKLVQGLTDLSAKGEYLYEISKIIKYVGGLIGK